MYTQCPHCDAIFQLTTAQLKAANGEVRCGQCLTVFNALDHLSDDIPTTAAESTQKPTDDNSYDDLWANENLAAASTVNASTEPAADEIESTVVDNDDLLDTSPATTPIDGESDTVIEATSGTADEAAVDEALADEDVVEKNLTDEVVVDMTTDATPDTIDSETADDATDADIFSKIIAEASHHALPTEAIDRFEEFLSDTTPTSLPADAENSTSTEIDNEFADLTNEFDTPSVADNETPSAEKVGDAKLDDHEFGAPRFGEVEAVTAELDAEPHIDATDEFAEFDEYLKAADKVMGEKTHEPAASFRDDSSDDVDSTDSAKFKFSAAESAVIDTADSENEAIIIEEADLEPISSKIYTDKPEANVEVGSDSDIDKPIDEAARHNPALDDFSDLAETAAEVAASSESVSGEPSAQSSALESGTNPAGDESRQTSHNIPALILEDLHAAKAEQLRPSNTPWVIGSLLLMLTLLLQVVYHSRDELAKDASLRPWLIQMCQYANCTLTQPYDIKQIDIIGREVRSHPSARKALIASTTLINNANYVQPFPLLTVVFSDINGKPLAQRRFTPREYLSNTVDLAAGMTPNLPVRIELELVDPGKAAVNYEFRAELDPRNTRPLT